MLKMRTFIKAKTSKQDKQPYKVPMFVDLLSEFLKKTLAQNEFSTMPMGKTHTEKENFIVLGMIELEF